jgi:hypothetical protein
MKKVAQTVLHKGWSGIDERTEVSNHPERLRGGQEELDGPSSGEMTIVTPCSSAHAGTWKQML